MKKTIIVALALVAGASFSPAEAQLRNSSDSVSYAAGMMMTNGLVPYLLQQKVDTAYMADFMVGFKEMLQSESDPRKAAYVMGMNIAKQLTSQMMPMLVKDYEYASDSIVPERLYKGFEDALMGDTALFTTAAATEYFNAKQQVAKVAREEALYGPVREAGRKFLEENAKKEGVITLPSGLQYKVLVKGEGEVPQANDKVQVNYEGRLIDGTVFDASAKHGDKPAEFTPAQVIRGWTEALTMMPVGSKWQLYIPYDLAYGERGAGNDIKPFSTLIFDIELVGIVK